MAKWGIIKFSAGVETPASSCRVGGKRLPPTCHQLFLRAQVPWMFISVLSGTSALLFPLSSHSQGCARPQVGSHLHGAWRKSLGFWVRWGFGVLCISKATAPSIPWPRTGPVSVLGQEPGPGSVSGLIPSAGHRYTRA